MKRCALSGCGASAGIAEHVDRHLRPLARHAKGDLDRAAGLARPVARLDHVARIAEREADVAGGEIVDVLRRMEPPYIGPHRLEQRQPRGRDRRGRGSCGRGRDRSAPPASPPAACRAARCRSRSSFCGDSRIEHQREAVARRRIRPERALEHRDVVADPGHAPQIRHAVRLPGSAVAASASMCGSRFARFGSFALSSGR